ALLLEALEQVGTPRDLRDKGQSLQSGIELGAGQRVDAEQRHRRHRLFRKGPAKSIESHVPLKTERLVDQSGDRESPVAALAFLDLDFDRVADAGAENFSELVGENHAVLRQRELSAELVTKGAHLRAVGVPPEHAVAAMVAR